MLRCVAKTGPLQYSRSVFIHVNVTELFMLIYHFFELKEPGLKVFIVKFGNISFLFNRTPAGRTSDSMTVPP